MDASARDIQDLTGEPLLKAAPRVEYRGRTVPTLGGMAILRGLGHGGMGVVYLGVNPDLEVPRAVKILPASNLHGDAKALRRFLREARLAATVQHPNLVQTLDVRLDEPTGLHYIVMEFVDGVTATAFMKPPLGPLSEHDALQLIIAATEGVAAAHRKGIVHRDLKPPNLLIPREGTSRFVFAETRVADLGLARLEESEGELTDSLMGMGTVGYMAPEQFVDVKYAKKPADVFGLGATLHALIAGEAPFRGKNRFERQTATMKGEFAPLNEVVPGVSQGTVELITSCLKVEPTDRFPDGPALLAALGEVRAALGESVERDWEPSMTEFVHRGEEGEAVRTPTPTPESAPAAVEAKVAAQVPTVRASQFQPPKTERAPKPRARRSPMAIYLVAAIAVAAGLLAIFGGTNSPERGGPNAPEEAAAADPGRGKIAGSGAPVSTSTGLYVFSDPPGARITVDGTDRGIVWSEGLLLFTGPLQTPVTIKAWLDDHRPAQQVGITWDGSERKDIHLVLKRLSGFLVLKDGIAGAHFEAEREGAEPIRAALAEGGALGPMPVPVGDYAVTVTLPGYDPWTDTVTVNAGRTTDLTLALRERDGTLAVDTDPTGADVYDGETLLGSTPLAPTILRPGKHSLRFSHPARSDFPMEIDVRGEGALDLGTIPLPELAVLDLSELPSDVTAVLRGRQVAGELRLKSGEVVLELSYPKHEPLLRTVQLKPGETLVLVAPIQSFQPKPSFLDLSALPEDCAVTLDGHALSRAPSQQQVEAGDRRVELARDGYLQVPPQTVTVGIAETKELENPTWILKPAFLTPYPVLSSPPLATLAAHKAMGSMPIGFTRESSGRILCVGDSAEMVLVPNGELSIPAGRGRGWPILSQRAEVRAVAAFLMDRTEVTSAAFLAFLNATSDASARQRWTPQGWGVDEGGDLSVPKGKDWHPVTGITFEAAVAFARHHGKRLPTEVEWERAARGDEGLLYPWGDAWQDAAAVAGGIEGPRAVGTAPADTSPFGAVDMAGNVSEVCATYVDGKPVKGKVKDTDQLVRRGGNFQDSVDEAANDYRYATGPSSMARTNRVGFRCVISVSSEPPPPKSKEPEAEMSEQVQRALELLRDRDAGVRFSAAIELGKLGDRRVWQDLVKVLRQDDDVFVRRACVRSLGETGAYEAFPGLVEALADSEEYVAKQASLVVREMAGQDFGYKQKQPSADRSAVCRRARSWWAANKVRLIGEAAKGSEGGGATVGEAVNGRVLAVDAKMDIYVIGSFSSGRPTVGQELTVYRDDTFVAVVVVDKVFKDSCSCHIKVVSGRRLQKLQVKLGDSVATVL